MIQLINTATAIIMRAVKKPTSDIRTIIDIASVVSVIDSAISEVIIVPIIPASRQPPLLHTHGASKLHFLLAATKLPATSRIKNKTASPKEIHMEVTILGIFPRLNVTPIITANTMLTAILIQPQAEKLQFSLHPIFSDISY